MMTQKRIQPRRGMTVDVLLVSDRFASVAVVDLFDPEGLERLRTATGSVKKNHGDIYDPDIDMDLAVGRALMNLGEQMIRDGNKAVRKAEHERNRKRVDAALARTRQSPRHDKDAGQLSILEIQKRYGDEAAQLAAERRAPALLAEMQAERASEISDRVKNQRKDRP